MSAPEEPDKYSEEDFKKYLETTDYLILNFRKQLSRRQFQGPPSDDDIKMILSRAKVDEDIYEEARTLTTEFKAKTYMNAELVWSHLANAAKRESYSLIERKYEVYITTEIWNPRDHAVLLTLVVEIPKELAITPSEILVWSDPNGRPQHPHVSSYGYNLEMAKERARNYTVLKEDPIIQVPLPISANMAGAIRILLPNYPDESCLECYQGPVITKSEKTEYIMDLYY